MKNPCDLHTHSWFSDGTCSPEEIIRMTEAASLSAVALTDHNTVAGIPAFLSAAKGHDLLAIPGVEISTGWHGTELHILGLFLQPEELDTIEAFLREINRRKEDSNRNLIRALSRAGYCLDYDTIRSTHPEGTVNRSVIAAALLEKGYVSSIEDAFRHLLSPRHGFFVPPERIPALEVLRFLASIHAVSVLAHPFLNLTEEGLRQFLPEAKAQGLAAMETVYSSYSSETAALADRIAAEYALLPSGGSDFHGQNKPDILLGTGKGSLYVPWTYAQQLQHHQEAFL